MCVCSFGPAQITSANGECNASCDSTTQLQTSNLTGSFFCDSPTKVVFVDEFGLGYQNEFKCLFETSFLVIVNT